MNNFLGNDYMLGNETASLLYHNYAAKMPVIDYHCHINPMEIARNHCYENITQLLLSGDHYKWRLMRANGIDESLITGNSDDYDKFIAFAGVIPKAAGNPVYLWTHLELKRYFECDLTLSSGTADDIWHICNAKLSGADMSVRGIINRSSVEVIITTDDPADMLTWHKAIAEDKSFKVTVLPGFRPDKAIDIEKPDYSVYLQRLEDASGISISSFNSLCSALVQRIDYFEQMGCRVSDHGLYIVPFAVDAEVYAPAIFEKALNGKHLSDLDITRFKTAMLLFLGKQYAARDWVMQIHYGALRNINHAMYIKCGPDVGNDAVSSCECSRNIALLLSCLEQTDQLSKTILYSLNPNDDAVLSTIAGCFSGNGISGKVQHGSAWWFNDSKPGIEAQLTSLASRGLLGSFIGMLTDSRSVLSYTRHEYFRRVLCNLLGKWVESGEYPADIEMLGSIVRDISYCNTKTFFGF